MIAFLGTGLMGSGFVRALLARGEQVQVWNRTAAKARALEQHGARAFDSPAEAVRGASRVHLSLSDDASVESILAAAKSGLAKDALLLDHTTTAPKPTAERIARLRAEGLAYLHAPVVMGPRNAQDATGLMLASGAKALYERARPELEKMTGKLIYLGEREDKAAAFKLFGNLMIVAVAAGLADVLALASGLQVDLHEALALFDTFKIGNQLDYRGKKMAAGDFTPSFELGMARKDVRLMLESAEQSGAKLTVVPAVAELMDALLAAGQGDRDLGVLAQRAFERR